MAKVSIQVPVYNGEKHLVQTLQSIADNAPPDSEILVMDDGSSDNSCKIIKDFVAADSRFIFEQNRTDTHIRYIMVEHCTSEYIIPFDHDDIFLPEREEHIAYLDSHSEAPASYGISLAFENQMSLRYFMGANFSNFLIFLEPSPVPHGSLTIRRQSILDAGNYLDPYLDENGIARGSFDWYMVQRLGLINPLHFIAKPTYLYRLHPNQHSKHPSFKNHNTRSVALEKLKKEYTSEIKHFLIGDISNLPSPKVPLYTQIAGIVANNAFTANKNELQVLRKAEQLKSNDAGINKYYFYYYLKMNDKEQALHYLSLLFDICRKDCHNFLWWIQQFTKLKTNDSEKLIPAYKQQLNELEKSFVNIPIAAESLRKYFNPHIGMHDPPKTVQSMLT